MQLLMFTLFATGQIANGQVVDASGEQDAVFRVAETGMQHIFVTSDAGTSCSIADHLRGPFADSGAAGSKNCDVDLLLDAGLYKARLQSPQRGKGKAQLQLASFVDAAPAVKLDEGAHFDLKLAPRTQASAWLHLDSRQAVTIEVAGRTAGKVGLWRDGRWLEDASMRDDRPTPRAGKQIHHWRIDAVLDPGDTKLVVYGTDSINFTKGPDEDVVFVTRGAPAGSAARAQSFTLPTWGFAEVAVPDAALAAFVDLDRAPTSPVSLVVEAMTVRDPAVGAERGHGGTSCMIAPSAASSACALVARDIASKGHVLTIVGPPGTTGTLSWGKLAPDNGTADGGYWPMGREREIVAQEDGEHFVTAAAFPMSMDAEPLGCAVDQVDATGHFVRRLAIDAPSVSWTEGFARSFNTDATSTAVWVQIDKPGLYSISGDEKSKASCEVMKVDGWDKKRVGGGEDGKCNMTRALSSGLHEVRFYGGRPGIQTLTVAQVGVGNLSAKKTPAKAACTFPSLTLSKGARYRLVTSSDGGATLRAFFAMKSPLTFAEASPVAIDPMREVSLPIGIGAPVVVRAKAGVHLRCTLDGTALPAANGTCRTGAIATASTLVIQNDDDMPALAIVARDLPPADEKPSAFDPKLAKLPTITDAAPLWIDFDRSQSRSMIVDVDKPGLYDVETEGLLATSCRLRTPTIGALVDGSQNGRGRNCLVQAYLKPGTYLFTATAQGRSKGRAGVVLTRKAPRDFGMLSVGDEQFFKVDAGDLVQETLDIKHAGSFDLASTAQGARELSCRVDDHDGWPIMPVPAACTQRVDLEPGRYFIAALPLTVESRRRTSLAKPAEEIVLEGDHKVHPLALNTPYQAQLGTDGKDEFAFHLAADLDVGVVLDHGMQGRIVRVEAKGKRGDVVETVPPVGGPGFAMRSRSRAALGTGIGSAEPGADDAGGAGEGGAEAQPDGEGASANPAMEGDGKRPPEGEAEGETAPTAEYGENEGERESGESGEGVGGEGNGGEENGGEGNGPVRAASRQAKDAAAAALAKATLPVEVAALPGRVVHLARGDYVLETEHSRGDVAIRYGVSLRTRALAPGIVMQVPVPGRVDVVMPKIADASSGLLRIKTKGDVDVRCRLRDSLGNLVAESADSGADWNCAAAVPLAAGTYSLTVEAEALQPGTTTLSAEFLEAKDTGVLKDGDSFKLVAKVASSSISPAGSDVVHDVLLTSEHEFSCAAQADDKHGGGLLDRRVGVRTCRMLLWPGEDHAGFRVFVWTPDRAASVKAIVRERHVHNFGGGKLDVDEAGRAHVAVRGRYLTGPDAVCRATSRGAGLLAPCFTAASFDAGDVVVAVPTGGRVSLDESIAHLAPKPHEERRTLDGTRAPERERSKVASLHLVQVAAPFGSTSSPSCAIDGGVSARDAATCAAAAGPLEESTLSTWTKSGTKLDATIKRRAVAWPAQAAPLPAGTSSFAIGTGAGDDVADAVRFALPSEGFRVKLALPSDAWAIFVDDAGHARDLCAPHRGPVVDKPTALSTCVMRGRGGQLVVVRGSSDNSPESRNVRADLLELSTAEAPTALIGLREAKPAFPGRERLHLAASDGDRVVRVEGKGALACSITLDDGAHVAGCRAQLPAGQGAEIGVEHDDRPWRVFTYSDRARNAAGARNVTLAAGRFGALPASSPTTTAPLGTAVALAGNVVDRRIDLAEASAVRIRATSGVCALAVAGRTDAWRILESQGLGGGCDIVRVLPKGSHRVVVRGFGTAPLSGNVDVTAEPVVALADGVGPEALVASGDARTYRFDLQGDGEVGVGLETDADTLDCTLLDDAQDIVGDGCHQFHRLKRGTYYLRIAAPDDEGPRRFKPVVFGLKGDVIDVPDDWLRDFFARVGPLKASATSNEVHR